jgi:hypothetical protein
LGNQLFKFANALRISETFGVDICLDISWYRHNYMKSAIVSSRTFELDYFPEIRKLEKFSTTYPLVDNLTNRVLHKLSPISQKKIGLLSESNSKDFKKTPRSIIGDFIGIPYFPTDSLLLRYLKFPENYSNWYEKLALEVQGTNSVAVHVRRTDYLNLDHIYNVVDKNYYMKAIKLIQESNKDVALHLFSDDPAGAIKWLGKAIEFDSVIVQPVDVSSGEVLRLMSTYKCVVAANSTFSWWAAYIGNLNKNVNSIFLPKKFSNLNNDNPEKYLWIKGCQFI